jgi:capsular exopolysaccharide synthesis family protein
MSRIHEALKKAEQDKAGQEARIQATEVPANTTTESIVPLAVVREVPAIGPASNFTFDTLIARCPQGDWKPDAETMLFFKDEEYRYGTEEFRTLRSRLYQVREKQPLKKILVTSAWPKEGKSFVSANLTQAMAGEHGRRALLIDADLSGAKLHTTLGTRSSPGLAEYLRGESDEFGVVQRGPMENLFFIPAGEADANPAELLANGLLKVLLERLEPLFDWIIVDSPPAVPGTDGVLLSSCCDGVLRVVRSRATFDLARKGRQEAQEKNLVGLVLNGIEPGSSSWFSTPQGYDPVRTPDLLEREA